ncbi:MAG: hypothetical protein WHU94_03350 [Thermogemmata sp.]|jgi:hypothetical protein|uniref:Uncharacterized protein n=1 Tax=Thermogemmata fonticola TaxID=2755323 RepID=A0A7V8VFP1_9BACT|nr:hypothetical protein [Thermogemmata fonticola]MBA2227081.1 hypothetical protein [Thermogemmata fonticola]MCX8138361.1 hypothetical protein [Gemmataceae bacterium]
MDFGKSDWKDWGRELIRRWLDSDHQVSLETLKAKKWLALPVADILNPMEAEWLADAIHSLGVEEAIGVAFEYNGDPNVETVPVSRDHILTYNGSNSWRYVIITSSAELFLYFKDEANRFYLVCGPADFVSQAYKARWETAKIMYFEWVNLDHHNDQEKRFLTEVWNKYATLTPDSQSST